MSARVTDDIIPDQLLPALAQSEQAPMKAWLLALVSFVLATATAWCQRSDPTPLRFHDAAEETRSAPLVTELRL
jgi:hypothetical protein